MITAKEYFRNIVKKDWMMNEKKALENDFYAIDEMAEAIIGIEEIGNLLPSEAEDVLREVGYDDAFFERVNALWNEIHRENAV